MSSEPSVEDTWARMQELNRISREKLSDEQRARQDMLVDLFMKHGFGFRYDPVEEA